MRFVSKRSRAKKKKVGVVKNDPTLFHQSNALRDSGIDFIG